jgi:hypothetical protein
MRRFPLRVVLLALGVLFGYGSAFAHMGHHHGCHGHAHSACHQHDCGCERDCH